MPFLFAFVFAKRLYVFWLIRVSLWVFLHPYPVLFYFLLFYAVIYLRTDCYFFSCLWSMIEKPNCTKYDSHQTNDSKPPIHLIHSIYQYGVMKKWDMFAMKERDIKVYETVKISLSVANLRNQAMLYSSLDIYLQQTLIILSRNIDWL